MPTGQTINLTDSLLTTNSVLQIRGGMANSNFLPILAGGNGSFFIGSGGSTITFGNIPNWLGNNVHTVSPVGAIQSTNYGIADVGDFYSPAHLRHLIDIMNHNNTSIYISHAGDTPEQTDDVRLMLWDKIIEELWFF